MCISSRASHCRTVLQNGHDKIHQAYHKEAIYHGILARNSSTYQAFEKLLWKPSEDASQKSSWNQMSLPIYQSIYQGHQEYITVPPIVNLVDWGCIVHDLETIIVLILLAFNFIPQRSHHSLTLPKSRFRDCYCNSNALGWHNRTHTHTHTHKKCIQIKNI